MRTKRSWKKKSGRFPKGFTLIEVLVTVLIFAVLAGAINMVLLVGEDSWDINRAEIEMIQEIRKAVSAMEDELRETAQHKITGGPIIPNGTAATTITFFPTAGSPAGTITWNADAVQYFLGEDLDGNGSLDGGEDVNGNGTLDVAEDTDLDGVLDTGEDINGNGKLDGGPILRIEGAETKIIAQNISQLLFTRSLATADVIDVDLITLKETTKGRIQTLQFSFSVQMRN